ncbi:MAG: site-2 protease family protein [Patescibacteria group bacterium]
MGPEIIFFIAILVMSVVIHEVSHGYTANLLGDPTARLEGRLTLNPLKHLDPFGSIILPLLMFLIPGGMIFGWAKPVPYNPYNLRAGKWGPALVAVAGPLSNLIIALFFGLLARSGLIISEAFLALAGITVVLNFSLMIFNLMPFPPLDGSKILFALLPYRWRAVQTALETYWWFFFLIFVFFLWNLVSFIVINLAVLTATAPIINRAFLAF